MFFVPIQKKSLIPTKKNNFGGEIKSWGLKIFLPLKRINDKKSHSTRIISQMDASMAYEKNQSAFWQRHKYMQTNNANTSWKTSHSIDGRCTSQTDDISITTLLMWSFRKNTCFLDFVRLHIENFQFILHNFLRFYWLVLIYSRIGWRWKWIKTIGSWKWITCWFPLQIKYIYSLGKISRRFEKLGRPFDEKFRQYYLKMSHQR